MEVAMVEFMDQDIIMVAACTMVVVDIMAAADTEVAEEGRSNIFWALESFQSPNTLV
jgi:hypothetical protein